ncbi:unnamed protein product [marine sediment metagenome]|uniref:Uncharacterized protein n=1 Tax=marine sediment metagenome TaxID=412755 RepID=X1K124_9ZZZZ
MSPGEAIEIGTRFLKDSEAIPVQDINEAIKLGIEALTLFKRCRGRGPVWLPMLLPGETPEGS